MSFVAHFQWLITDSFGILALLKVLFEETFGILALFQALNVNNFGIFNTIRKNKHHPGLEPTTSGITSRYSINFAANSLYGIQHVKQ